MIKSSFKNFILKSIVSIFLLTSVFVPKVSADIVDCRFINNERVKEEIVKHINPKGIQSLCKHCDVNFSDAVLDTQNMIFVADPLYLGDVDVYIPLVNKTNSEIFSEVSLCLEFSKKRLTMQRLLDFFVESKYKLSYRVSKGSFVYSTIGIAGEIKYKRADELEGLERTDEPQKILYSYPETRVCDYIIILQILDNGEKEFYDVTELPLMHAGDCEYLLVPDLLTRPASMIYPKPWEDKKFCDKISRLSF